MFENLRLSLQGIWAHKMRSFLTMLGIIIGIAAIIAIVSTIKGTNEQIKQNLIGSGSNLVNVCLYQDGYQFEFNYQGVPDGVPVLSDATYDEISSLEDVEAVSFFHQRVDWNNQVAYEKNTMDSVKITGVDKNYFTTCGYTMLSGRCLTEKDIQACRMVAVLDDNMADALFQSVDPVGKTILIGNTPLVIIGVVKEKNDFQPVINSMEDYYNYANDGSSGILFVPSTIWPVIYQYDEPEQVVVRAKSTDSMTEVGKKVQNILNQNVTSENVSYKAEDLLEQASQLQSLSASTNQQLIWIASISLLVGGIGVMNIMLVSVTERTREIGLKKAIGARKGRILGQFLSEAAMLTSLGGAIGVLAGIGLAQLISKLTQTPVAIDPLTAIGAVAFSMAIGIIFGLMPSVKAANLDPIEALRRE